MLNTQMMDILGLIYLNKKKEYVSRCLVIVKDLIKKVSNYGICELTATDAFLTTMLSSLGISYPPEISPCI